MSEPSDSDGYRPLKECFQMGQNRSGILQLEGFVKRALQSAWYSWTEFSVFATFVKLTEISWSLLSPRVSPATVTDVP